MTMVRVRIVTYQKVITINPAGTFVTVNLCRRVLYTINQVYVYVISFCIMIVIHTLRVCCGKASYSHYTLTYRPIILCIASFPTYVDIKLNT